MIRTWHSPQQSSREAGWGGGGVGVNFRPQKVACVASAFCWGGAVEGSASKHAKPRKEWEGGFARAFAVLFLMICAFNLSVKCQRYSLILLRI